MVHPFLNLLPPARGTSDGNRMYERGTSPSTRRGFSRATEIDGSVSSSGPPRSADGLNIGNPPPSLFPTQLAIVHVGLDKILPASLYNAVTIQPITARSLIIQSALREPDDVSALGPSDQRFVRVFKESLRGATPSAMSVAEATKVHLMSELDKASDVFTAACTPTPTEFRGVSKEVAEAVGINRVMLSAERGLTVLEARRATMDITLEIVRRRA